jgi:excinuclease UvrABC ATPase subunit
MHSLLLKWTESILEIPTLVKLGYGEVISPVIETEDDDDVSSFGNNHEENDTKIQQDELNPHMTQLSFQSIERLCRAARGSNIALTDKEKAIIERINTKRQRSSCSDNNSYPIASGCKESIPDTNVTNVATETILEEFQETSNNIRMNEEKKRTEEQTMQTSSFQKDTRHGIIVADEVDSVTRKTSNSNSKAALKFIPSRAPLRPNNHKTSTHASVSTGGDKNEEDDSSDDEDEPVVVRYSKRIAIWACADDVPAHKMQRKL